MKQFNLFLMLMALLSIAALPAYSATEQHKADPDTKNNSNSNDQKVYHLGSMTVTAHSSKIKILCAFRSTFLTEFSPDPAKADDIICRTEPITGSHFHRLWCITNRQYFQVKRTSMMHNQPPTFVTHALGDAGVQPISARTVKRLVTDTKLAATCKQEMDK